MAGENVLCESQVVSMFWDFGSAVSSQQQPAATEATSSNRSSGSKRASRPTKCSQAILRSSQESVRDVKRETVNIALDCDTEFTSTSESSDRENTHRLSDGNIIAAGAECFRCAGMLLQPSCIGEEASGNHNASSQITMKCGADTCKDLPESCCTMASPYSKGLVSTRRSNAT